MSALRLGIVGAGAIARLSCREIVGHPDAQIVAAADPNLDRLDELRQAFAIPRTYTDPAALFADPAVDAVYIAVPNQLHAPLARAALAAGKHTLLDKPFALSLAEAETVVAAARASGRQFMVGMNQRFGRGAQKLRARVASGELGEVYHVKAFWRRRTGIPRIGSWFGNKSIAGGGGLLDIGVHMLDLALFLIDDFDIASVSGATYTKFGNRGLGDGAWGLSERDQSVFDVDDFATALIKLRSGATLALDAAWAMHQEQPNDHDVLLYGTNAGASTIGEKLFRYGGGRGEYEVLQSPAGDVRFPHASRFHHFIDVVLGREAPVVTIEQSLVVQRVLDAIYSSAASGREVRF